MSDDISIVQKSALGSETTQIGNQNNYYGMTPEEASQTAIKLFMDNFPKLQEEANRIVHERVDELVTNVVSEIEQKYSGNYSAFSTPDMQYILVQAEKGYARRGTSELCSMLSSLIADRSACTENSYLEMVLDKAIELAPSLSPLHLDYLSLIFLYKHVRFGDLSTIESVQERFAEIHNCFSSPASAQVISYLNMLGILTIQLGEASEMVARTYGFAKQDILPILPSESKMIPGDYGLTPAGIVLAIFNAHSKSRWKFNLHTWIHE